MEDIQAKHSVFSPIELLDEGGASAVIYPYAAHLSSWKTANGKDWIFLSEQAKFQQGAAIRGGVPIIFPQFNAFGSGPRHGFARNRPWTVIGGGASKNECTFSLVSDDETLELWPHKFHAKFHVKLIADKIEMTLKVENTGEESFTFTCALHSYFAVNDYCRARVDGLCGLSYWDNDGSPFSQRQVQQVDRLTFTGPIDRVYFSATQALTLVDGADSLSISSSGFSDVVIWNPGIEAVKTMGDFGDSEHSAMLCIEAAVIDSPITLAAGQSWAGSQILEAQ